MDAFANLSLTFWVGTAARPGLRSNRHCKKDKGNADCSIQIGDARRGMRAIMSSRRKSRLGAMEVRADYVGRSARMQAGARLLRQ